MERTSIPDPPGFGNLSKSEQLEYLQALWDRISEHSDAIPVPESHLQLAESRLQASRRNPNAARSAFDVIDRLVKRSR